MSLIKKFFGLALLFAGLAVIFYGLYSSYNIFTAKNQAPEIFTIEKKNVVSPSGQIEQLLQEQLRGILPTDSIPKLFNLISWSVLAGILIFGGAQISGMGIKLLR